MRRRRLPWLWTSSTPSSECYSVGLSCRAGDAWRAASAELLLEPLVAREVHHFGELLVAHHVAGAANGTAVPTQRIQRVGDQIGRASCRERGETAVVGAPGRSR